MDTQPAIIILAAGKGTRMLSKKQKILHEVGGKPMVRHVVDAAQQVSARPPTLVVGVAADDVRALLGDSADYVVQDEQKGTGHAVQVTRTALQGRSQQVIVIYADMPLLRAETLRRLAQTQAETGAAVVLLSVIGETDWTYGRIVRDAAGDVLEIVEVAEARQRPNPDHYLSMREMNVGVYCFSAEFLWNTIGRLPLRQARSGQEYYLTDMVEFAVKQGQRVVGIIGDDRDECLGAGTRSEMVGVERAFRRRTANRWLASGVTLIDPDHTYIDPDVTIGQDTIIWPNTYLQGTTTIGADCVIGPNTIIRDTTVGSGCHIVQSLVNNAFLGDGTVLPPFTHLDAKG